MLLNLGNLPIIGDLIGFNTLGGITLVMVAFDLPLGIWLMKGFFDNISWDMETLRPHRRRLALARLS